MSELTAGFCVARTDASQVIKVVGIYNGLTAKHGYVTTRDARDLDIDPTQLRLMAARGRLERAGRGVYRVPLLPRGAHDELAAAVAWSLGRGVVSHESALQLHGLADVNPSRIHLTVPRENHPRAAGGEMYRTHRRDLAPSDVTQVDSLPVTTVTRTHQGLHDHRHGPLPAAAGDRSGGARRNAAAHGRGTVARRARSAGCSRARSGFGDCRVRRMRVSEDCERRPGAVGCS